MKLSEIKKNPNNPRQIRGEQFERLKKSLSEFPQMMSLRPIVIDSDNTVLGGNMRLQALKSLKFKEIPDEWVKRAEELTDEQKKRFIVSDNGAFGEWDFDALANSWDDLPLADWGVDLPEDWLTNGHKEEDESTVSELIDKAAELQQKWQVSTGQIWQIGRHRLLVGDCTEKANVEALCGDNRPFLCVTDPPYGVNYKPVWRVDAGLDKGCEISTGTVTADDESDWGQAYRLFDGGVVYVWHADRFADVVKHGLEQSGYEIRAQIVWGKPHYVMSRGHYHWQHEPCWYGVRKGMGAQWIGDSKQSTLWQIDNASWQGGCGQNSGEQTGHGTQKPLECMARPIRNHAGDVYDPFIGSGTTMVAAEQLNRICYGMDISEKYCAVTLERMSALGLAPELLENVTET